VADRDRNEDGDHQVVSFDSEELILVDADDNEVGHLDKAGCHRGAGVLHRAFSIFVFNPDGELLLPQRSADKPLWPLYWSNTCCSHPRRGESQSLAAERRLQQELGLSSSLRFVYKFQYHAQFNAEGAERELCTVFLGRSDQPPQPNPNEVAAWRFVSPAELERELRADSDGERFTPWFRMEWERLTTDYRDLLECYTGPDRSNTRKGAGDAA